MRKFKEKSAFKEIVSLPHRFWQFVDSSKEYDVYRFLWDIWFLIEKKIKPILLTYGLPKQTIIAIKILYKNTKEMVHSSDGDTVNGVLQWGTSALYLFILCLVDALETSIDLIKENGFKLKR